MTKVNPLAVGLCCALLAVAACSKGGGGGPPDAGPTVCKAPSDCSTPFKDADGGTRPQVCIAGTCTPTCTSNAQCIAGQVCDGTCNNAGCGSNSDCGGSQICSGGACKPAPTASSVASCDITPNPAVVAQGTVAKPNKVQLSAVAKDSSGTAIAFSAFTWTVTSGNATVDATGLVTPTGAGPITIGAAAGNSANCSGTVNAYATSSAGVRVVVISEFDKKPIKDATVRLDITNVTTDPSGVASFPGVASGAHDIHVLAGGFDYFSILGTSNTDLLVPLVPAVPKTSRSGFKGTILAHCPDNDPTCADATFTNLNVPGDVVHLAFFGSAIPGSPIDISVQTLIGQLRAVTLCALGKTLNYNLPSGLVLGVNGFACPGSDDLWGTGAYTINAEAGKRILWGIGGNLGLNDALPIVTPLIGGTKIDVGQVLAQLLPLFGKLQAGQIVDVQAPDNGLNPTFKPVAMPLNTLLRLRATLQLPDMPKQDGQYLGAAAAVGGSLDYPLGYVPLGLTAGLSKDSAGTQYAKILDPSCASVNSVDCATGKLPMRLAPENNGLEGQPWGFIALAANLSGLSLSGSGSGTSTIALSGLFKPTAEVKYVAPPADGALIDFTTRTGGFMSLPNADSAKLTVGSRQFMIPSAGVDTTAKFFRIGVQGNGGLNWNIWVPATKAGQTITLPIPGSIAAGMADPLADTPVSSLFLTASLTGSQAFSDISGFGNVTLDQLGTNIDAFTLTSTRVQ